MLDHARRLYRIAAAVWLGAIVFLVFALSTVAFVLVPPHEIAVLLGWAIWGVFPAAIGAGLITAGTLAWRAVKGDRPYMRARTVLVTGALGLCCLALWLGLRMDALQRPAGEAFWQMPHTVVERQAFDHAHRDAEGMLGVTLLILLAIVGLG